MSLRHLSRGSRNPPLNRGKLRLYSMRFCPYAQRVHLVLDAKKIPYDVVNINLTDKPDWLFDKSPLGKVPALELENGETLYESLIICDYLDEKYQHRPLHPRDPLRKAKDKILVEHFNKVIGAMYKIYYNSNKSSLSADHVEEFLQGLEFFEKELEARGSKYFGACQNADMNYWLRNQEECDRPGMLDYMIWPWCERSDMMKILGGDQFILPRERFTRLLEWRNAMKDDEAVRESYLEPQLHAKYFQSRQAGYPAYDMLLNNL